MKGDQFYFSNVYQNSRIENCDWNVFFKDYLFNHTKLIKNLYVTLKFNKIKKKDLLIYPLNA